MIQMRMFLNFMKLPSKPFSLQSPRLAHVFRVYIIHRRFFFAALFIGSAALGALHAESPGPSSAKSTPKFEFLMKRQTFRFLPYEYTSLTQISSYGSVYEPVVAGGLGGNEKVLVPAACSCEDCIESWRLEASYYEIELPAANAILLRSTPTSLVLTRQYLNPTARSEALGTALRRISLSGGWTMYVGGGIQNINKYTYGANTLSGSPYQEYFFTYGPAASMRLTGALTDSFSITFQSKMFATTGTRFASSASWEGGNLSFPPGAALTIRAGTAHTRGVYRGAEIDVSGAFRIFDRFRIHIGYDHIYSYFSYLHYHQTNITFPVSGIPTVSYPPKTGNHEIVSGLYAALSITF